MNQKQTNVLFISSWYPTRITPLNGDFIQRHAEAVSKYCNVQFLYVAYDPHLRNKFEKIEGNNSFYKETIIYFKVKSAINFILKLFKLYNYHKYYTREFKLLLKNNFRPHIIHANVIWPVSLIAYLIKRKYNIPYIVSEHYTKYILNEKFGTIQKVLSKLIVKNAGCICPVSKVLKYSLETDYKFKGNYKIVSNVVNENNFTVGSNSLNDEKIPILHISSLLDRHKNISGIINALSKIKLVRDDFKLIIIHSGDNTKISTYIENKGLQNNVEFISNIPNKKVADILKSVAFVVMFSNYETQGCVILESLMSGIPVVSSNVGGIDDYINENNGILVHPGDEAALKEAIIKMLDTHSQYNKTHIRDIAIKNFSYDAIGKKFYNIYSEVISIC